MSTWTQLKPTPAVSKFKSKHLLGHKAAGLLGHSEGKVALTDTALKALKPKERAYTLADERGLYVEVFPSGGVVWRFRYRIDGKQEKLTLGK